MGIKILLAEDHVMVREGLHALLSREADLEVVAEAGTGGGAVQLALEHLPDVVVMDISLPVMNGIEATRLIVAAGSGVRVLALSMESDRRFVVEVLKAGADGYLLKDGPARHLLEAITYVRDGGQYVSPLLRGAGLFTTPEASVPDDPLALLSPREIEVFTHLVKGMRAKDIAELLHISPKTVDTYRATLMRKLNVHDIVGLVKFAIECLPDAGANS